jgi:hypothetical protein
MRRLMVFPKREVRVTDHRCNPGHRRIYPIPKAITFEEFKDTILVNVSSPSPQGPLLTYVLQRFSDLAQAFLVDDSHALITEFDDLAPLALINIVHSPRSQFLPEVCLPLMCED